MRVRLGDRLRSLAATRLVRDEAPLLTLVVAYLALGATLGAALGLDFNRYVGLASLVDAAAWSAAVTAIVVGSYLAVFGVQQGLARLGRAPADTTGARRSWSQLWRTELDTSRVAGLFVTILAIATFMDAFVGFKAAIPLLQSFNWDQLLMELDRRVHLGQHPWRLLQPMLGRPRVTKAVDLLYYSWFVVLGLTLVWQAWSRGRSLRAQFFVSYVAMWIVLGTLAATAFSSAGPCYYGRVVGAPDPFAPLIEYLAGVDADYPLIALRVQDYLWQGYASPAAQAVEGISAMPSLHVATPVLLALLGWRTSRWLGLAYTSYALIVLVGSVHLGWHYAVDGYASILAVPLIWKASGAAVAWYARRVGVPADGGGAAGRGPG